MAAIVAPHNTFTAGAGATAWAAGNTFGYLEDVSKAAPSLIDPADAPAFKKLGKVQVRQVQHDYMTDALETRTTLPDTVLYEADPSYGTTLARGRGATVVQQFKRTWKIAEISEIIAGLNGIAGIASEVQRAIELQLIELGKDIENVLLSEQAAALQAAQSGTGSSMGGFFSIITTNMTDLAAVATESGVDETKFQDKVKAMYDAGAGAGGLWALCTTAFMLAAARTFKGRESVREVVQRGDHKVDTILETYAGPVGGLVTLEPDRSILGDGLALISRDLLKVGELRGIRVFRTDKDEQHPRGYMNWYGTLVPANEKAHGGWKNDSTLTT